MTAAPMPRKISTTLVVALMLATGVLAAAAITTSMDTLVPLLRGEGWASGRALSEQTVALTVEATMHDPDHREPIDTGNPDRLAYRFVCVPKELPAAGVTIDVWTGANRSGQPTATGWTGGDGRVTFDLTPGHYEIEAHHDSWRPTFLLSPRPIELDQDKLMWLQAPHNRSTVFAEPSPVPDANGTGWYFSLRESFWTEYARGTFVAAGAAHPLVFVPIHANETGTVRISPEPDRAHEQRTWQSPFAEHDPARFRLPEGAYEVNVTWSDGRYAERVVTLDRSLVLRQEPTGTSADVELNAGRMPEIQIRSGAFEPCA